MKYSIIIPVYNADKFVEKTVASVLMQTYEDFEIILIDVNVFPLHRIL